jgi:hypothetical protein
MDHKASLAMKHIPEKNDGYLKKYTEFLQLPIQVKSAIQNSNYDLNPG